MSNFKTGKEVLQDWIIKDFELFGFIKEGLQPYDIFGRPLPPPDISSKKFQLNDLRKKADSLKSYNFWIRLSPQERTEYFKKDPIAGYAVQQGSRLAQSEYDKAMERIEQIEKELSQIMDLNSWVHYEFPESAQEARRVLDVLVSANYKINDLEKARKIPDLVGIAKPENSLESDDILKDFDSFIRNVKISYESDIEIKVQFPHKPLKVYDHKGLGFARSNTKEWKDLISIIENGFYSTGTFVKGRVNSEYERRYKRLSAINKKLREFFNKEFGTSLPESFQAICLSKGEREGTFKPLFRIEEIQDKKTEKDYRAFSAEQLRNERKKLMAELLKNEKGQLYKNQVRTRLNILVDIAKEKGMLNFVVTDETEEFDLNEEIAEAKELTDLE